jgi:hypothetical protein
VIELRANFAILNLLSPAFPADDAAGRLTSNNCFVGDLPAAGQNSFTGASGSETAGAQLPEFGCTAD